MRLFEYFVVANRYSLRLEAMLQKEEFQITLETIEPTIEALKGAIEGKINVELLITLFHTFYIVQLGRI